MIYALTLLFLIYEVFGCTNIWFQTSRKFALGEARTDEEDRLGCVMAVYTVFYLAWLVFTMLTPYWVYTFVTFIMGAIGMGSPTKRWVNILDSVVSIVLLLLFMFSGLNNWAPLI